MPFLPNKEDYRYTQSRNEYTHRQQGDGIAGAQAPRPPHKPKGKAEHEPRFADSWHSFNPLQRQADFNQGNNGNAGTGRRAFGDTPI